MEVKAENPLPLLANEAAHIAADVSPIIQAYFELCHLKQLYRQGWLRGGVPKERCESIAEHSFAAALLALWLAQAYFPELDLQKVVCMALLHDFGEVYAGDIIPSDALSAEAKHDLEARSVQQVFDKLPGGEAHLRLWEEFESGDTAEARFVRQIDRLDMGLQAAVYARQGLLHPDEFYRSAAAALADPQLKHILEEVQLHSAGISPA
jgi:putative hydrolase of HD superfamily